MKYVYLLLTLCAGSLLPVQAILNSRLGRQVGGSLMGVLLSFVVGTLCLLLANGLINSNALLSVRPGRTAPWYLWLGGFLGAVFFGLHYLGKPAAGRGAYIYFSGLRANIDGLAARPFWMAGHGAAQHYTGAAGRGCPYFRRRLSN